MVCQERSQTIELTTENVVASKDGTGPVLLCDGAVRMVCRACDEGTVIGKYRMEDVVSFAMRRSFSHALQPFAEKIEQPDFSSLFVPCLHRR